MGFAATEIKFRSTFVLANRIAIWALKFAKKNADKKWIGNFWLTGRGGLVAGVLLLASGVSLAGQNLPHPPLTRALESQWHQPPWLALEPKRHLSTWLGFHTHHITHNPDHNETNHINGVVYNEWFLSRFTNSYGLESWVFGKNLLHRRRDLGRHWHLDARFGFGFATGYGRRLDAHIGGIVTPGLVPALAVGYDWNPQWSTRVDMLYIPTDKIGVLTFGLVITRHW